MAAATLSHRLSMISLTSTQAGRREFTRLEKQAAAGHLTQVWSDLEADLPKPLEHRFVDLKKRLVPPEQYEALQASWDRLRIALKERAVEIEAAGPDYIPTVLFTSIGPDGTFPEDIAKLIKSRGCCVIRGVVSREQALKWKSDLMDYVRKHPLIAGPPSAQDPQIWKTYWTKPQLEGRTHPDMIKAQVAMSKLYSCDEDTEVDVGSQALYADRFRIRWPGDSGTLPYHLDNGSIERWEDEENSKTFSAIWEGRWEEYDAFDMNHRTEACVDLYGGPGACSVFRSLQGWLSLADNGPKCGTIELLPDIKLSTAYILLRPFFDANNKLDMESTYFYGADPGFGQVVKDTWHPDLQLSKTVVAAPKAAPGDYVFWHCDMVHKVEEKHEGTKDSSVMYIPIVPLTAYNISNLVEQRKAFIEGVPPPDMISRDGEELEKEHEDRGLAKDILTLGGKRIFGLAPFDLTEDGITRGQIEVRRLANEALGFNDLATYDRQ
ncbi:DUF1479-domain-containing protein [Mollisia scopiformis]|uniref:DUF1479-domain-containing protein n=1 Tax=Mollisia scopiformis TaxID=149040 RepID=A0A194WWR8_MOLSC|nr:DUF1479-domain-containing protein [Mollisia scopiformis]KUJ12421.1 DUF1479-domain-containing protein [Mollisia scopiformis]